MRLLVSMLGVLLSGLFGSSAALAQSSLLIWPIDPTIEYDQKGTALWVENNGNRPIRLQIRVLAWIQDANGDNYTSQEAVIVSPPAAEVQAGQRQLLRLVRTQTVPANKEQAFRVLIDEIPGPALEEVRETSQVAPGRPRSVSLSLQMRYSVPLFVSGEGVWTKQDYQKPRDMSQATQPQLTFRQESRGGDSWLVLRNDGRVHARLSAVSYRQSKQVIWEVPGLLGYVLAQSETRFQLDRRLGGGILNAKINADVDEKTIPAQ